jgi:hypothetical protein
MHSSCMPHQIIRCAPFSGDGQHSTPWTNAKSIKSMAIRGPGASFTIYSSDLRGGCPAYTLYSSRVCNTLTFLPTWSAQNPNTSWPNMAPTMAINVTLVLMPSVNSHRTRPMMYHLQWLQYVFSIYDRERSYPITAAASPSCRPGPRRSQTPAGRTWPPRWPSM